VVTENNGSKKYLLSAITKIHISPRIFGLFGSGLCGRTDDLGVKGKAGILASMPSREEFLTDPDKKSYFTIRQNMRPWMNQLKFGLVW